MSEVASGSFSIDTYLSKQEGLLLEHIRRMLQAETKIALLEAALQDMYKRNEELVQQNETTKVTLDQAVNGLTAVTEEKIRLEASIKDLELVLKSTRNDLNAALIHKGEVDKLNEKLSVAESDYSALKQNYNIVLEQYNAIKPTVVEVSAPVEKKSKKVKSTESEWADGKY
jgi:chromosome segregation ATPase